MVNSPNFALYVAIIGFVSSLIVVLINAAVTLASKKIDAQQKKDDNQNALRVVFISRKVQTAEAAISKWTIHLKQWVLLKEMYLDIAVNNQTIYTKAEKDVKKARLSLASSKSEAASFTENDSFYLYFDAEQFHLFDKKDYTEYYTLKKQVNDTITEVNETYNKYWQATVEELEDEREGLYGDYAGRRDALDTKIKEIVTFIDSEVTLLHKNCSLLRRQMAVYDFQ